MWSARKWCCLRKNVLVSIKRRNESEALQGTYWLVSESDSGDGYETWDFKNALGNEVLTGLKVSTRVTDLQKGGERGDNKLIWVVRLVYGSDQ